MDGTYGHLSLEERCTIAQLHQAGQSCRAIAAALDRAASTVSRELKRTRRSTVDYRAGYAAEQAWAQRWRVAAGSVGGAAGRGSGAVGAEALAGVGGGAAAAGAGRPGPGGRVDLSFYLCADPAHR